MNKYKKEEPRSYPDWGQLHTPPVPKTIEHYLADIIHSASLLHQYETTQCGTLDYHPSRLKDIIHDARKAWDSIPEDPEDET